MAAQAAVSMASRGEMSARPASRIAATCAAASSWRPVRIAASTRSIATHRACGTAGASIPGGLIAAASR